MDFALACALQRWMDLLMHVSAYDVNCQYALYSVQSRMQDLHRSTERLSALNIIKKKLFPWTVFGVGKFHLAGHKTECRYKWSFNFLPFGMADGEAAERVWSLLSLLNRSTREINPGHRHDRVNAFYTFLNMTRTFRLGGCPSRHLQRLADALLQRIP